MADNSPPTELEQDLANLNIFTPTVCSTEAVSPQAIANDGSNKDDKQKSESYINLPENEDLRHEESLDHNDTGSLRDNFGLKNIDGDGPNDIALLNDDISLDNLDDLIDIALLSEDISLENIDEISNTALFSVDIGSENIDDQGNTSLLSGNKSLENIDDQDNTSLPSGNKGLENINDQDSTALFSVDIGSENIDDQDNTALSSDDSDWEDIDDDQDNTSLSSGNKGLENINDQDSTALFSGNKGLENINDQDSTALFSVDIGSENIDDQGNTSLLSGNKSLENIDDQDNTALSSDDSDWEDIDDDQDNTSLLSGNKSLENIDDQDSTALFSVDIGSENIDDQDNTSLLSGNKSLENIDDQDSTALSSDDSDWEDVDDINPPIDPILLTLNEEQTKLYNFMNSDPRIKTFIHEPSTFDNDIVIYDKNEIDEIIDARFIIDKSFYLVKWKNWSRGFNTWERFGALYNSQEHIFDFKKKRQCTDKPINIMHLMLTRHIITKLFALFRTVSGLSLPLTPLEDVSGLIDSLNRFNSPQILRKRCIRSYLAILSLDFFRQLQYLELGQWKIDIYVMSQNNLVGVENNIDLEGPPISFAYVSHCIPQKGIIIPDNPPFSCSCRKNCQFSKKCCYKLGGNVQAYDANKNIKVSFDYPIFECNEKCKCTSSCINRVVQLNTKVKVCIFKSRYPGWALKTYNNINKGQFVGIYVGEIITVEECNQRLQNSSSSIDYTWKLDFNGPKTHKFIVDSTNFGNFTRFINHSCEANLSIYSVWINCLDRYFPQLALFANRKIFAGEQLTTDYFVRRSNDSIKKSGIKCHCEMKSCKGYYF